MDREIVSTGSDKKLVVMLAWLGAQPAVFNKYKELYSKEEFDTFIYYPTLKDFLWPKHGLSSALATLNKLTVILTKVHYSNIIVHAFSIGCYFYSLMLYQMRTHYDKYIRVRDMISAQIVDSPVLGSTSEMAQGVAKMISRRPAVVRIIKSVCLLYMALTKSQTVYYYDLMVEEVKFRSLAVPSLFLTSTTDPLIAEEAMISFCDQWKKTQPTTVRIWQDSSHIEHFRYHPDEYKFLLFKVLTLSSNAAPVLSRRIHLSSSKL